MKRVEFECPYCVSNDNIDVKNIEGELHLLKCWRCGELFALQVKVRVEVEIHGLAHVNKFEVTERLVAHTRQVETDIERGRKALENGEPLVTPKPTDTPAVPPAVEKAPDDSAKPPLSGQGSAKGTANADRPGPVFTAPAGAKPLPPGDYDRAKANGQHMYSSKCWCRAKGPSSVKNPWCRLLIDGRGRKEDRAHGLGDPPRRVTRYQGTYGGGFALIETIVILVVAMLFGLVIFSVLQHQECTLTDGTTVEARYRPMPRDTTVILADGTIIPISRVSECHRWRDQ